MFLTAFDSNGGAAASASDGLCFGTEITGSGVASSLAFAVATAQLVATHFLARVTARTAFLETNIKKTQQNKTKDTLWSICDDRSFSLCCSASCK